jgi:hypothetical protein
MRAACRVIAMLSVAHGLRPGISRHSRATSLSAKKDLKKFLNTGPERFDWSSFYRGMTESEGFRARQRLYSPSVSKDVWLNAQAMLEKAGQLCFGHSKKSSPFVDWVFLFAELVSGSNFNSGFVGFDHGKQRHKIMVLSVFRRTGRYSSMSEWTCAENFVNSGVAFSRWAIVALLPGWPMIEALIRQYVFLAGAPNRQHCGLRLPQIAARRMTGIGQVACGL